MKLLGVGELAARLPNALCGVFSILLLFNIGKTLKSDKFGFIWSLMYIGTLLPHVYFKSGIIDPVFNLFMFASIWKVIQLKNSGNSRYAWFGGLFLGLAVITKGPVALIIVGMTIAIYYTINRFKPISSLKQVSYFALAALLTTFLWFGLEVLKNGPGFLIEFIKYQLELFSGEEGGAAAGHQQPFYYHFVVVLVGCVPISTLALGSLKRRLKNEILNDALKWMTVLFFVVMILFSIVSTKIVHYSSMAYLPLSFIATYFIYGVSREGKMSGWIKILTAFMQLILPLLVLVVLCIACFGKEWLSNNINDPFVVHALQTVDAFEGWEWTIGVLYLLLSLIAVLYLIKQKMVLYAYSSAASVGLTVLMLGAFVLPKVEQYTQGSAIQFFENHSQEDCYMYTLGYKSYAPYFYGLQEPLSEESGLNKVKGKALADFGVEKLTDLSRDERINFKSKIQDYLLKGDIDKPTYITTKTHMYDSAHYGAHTIVKKEGGFVLIKRTPIPK